ncbi:MAG TPA: sugar phosphate nucleotidyltransferase [Dehalococcoidia bacterium]|nr:sugar phosphate nucleotidyltransferase [Dehalococcoidia bacterium]
MQILLPIAGAGTRVRPHTHARPKPMLSLAGKPVLGHLLDYLRPLGPSSTIIIVGERGDQVEEYVHANYAAMHPCFRTQTELKGQSHAIKMAADLIHEPLLIVFGDTLFEAPLELVTDSSVDGAVVVQPVPDPARFGVVELNADGFITRFIEKPQHPPSNLASIGVWMFNDHQGLLHAIDAQIAEADALKGEFYLAGALQRLLDAGGRFRPVRADGWHDTGTIDAVLETHRYLVEQHRRRPQFTPVAAIVEPCWIDPTAKLERCVVGPYVSIGPRVEIVDSVLSDAIIGEGTRIEGAVLRRSIVGNEAVIELPRRSFNISDHSSLTAAPPAGTGH